MNTEAQPEIIEIIEDGVDPFGDRTAITTYDDAGGPRWAGPIAAAVLVALIGYGVATSASSSGVAKVAPVSTTTVAPVTTKPVTTTEPIPFVPYYAADPPGEFTVLFAELTDPERDFFGQTRYQLWATDGATAATGSWFSIESSRGGPDSQVTTFDAHRVQSGRRSIAISHLPTGQSLAVFSIDRFTRVTLTSFGLSDDELVRVADSVTAQSDGLNLSDASVVVGYQLISTVAPGRAVEGNPAEQIFYGSSNIYRGGFNILVSPRPAPSEGGSTQARQIALRFLLDHATPFDVNGQTGVAGAVVDQQDQALATWTDGDHIVTLTATLTVPELISIARSVHQISPEEWNGIRAQASRAADRQVFDNFDQGTPVTVASGTDSASEPWSIEVAVQTYSDVRQTVWQWGNEAFSWSPGDGGMINTVVDDRRTYVLAELPRTIAAAGATQLQVSPEGLEPVLVRFTDIGADLDRTFAAYVFSEPTPFTVQIIGADGTVLGAWPSS
jgi:hypothetical protein